MSGRRLNIAALLALCPDAISVTVCEGGQVQTVMIDHKTVNSTHAVEFARAAPRDDGPYWRRFERKRHRK